MAWITKIFSAGGFTARRWSAERKAQAGFAFALLCLGVIGIISYWSVERLRADDEWSRHTEAVISSLRLLLSHVTDAETAQRGYAIAGDESYLEPYDEARRYLVADLEYLRITTADNPAQQSRLAALEPLVAQRMSRLELEIEIRRSQGFGAAQAATIAGMGKQLHGQIRGLVAEMETTEQALLKTRQLYAKRSAAVARAIIVVSSLLALGVVSVALVAIGRDLTRRRAQADQAAQAGRLSRMGAWAVEVPGFRQTWSDQVCAIYEVPPGSALPVAEAIERYAPEFRETITRAFETCVRDGTPYDIEIQIFTTAGRRVWVRSIGEARRNAAGVICRVQGALQDISDRKRAEEEARDLAGRLTTTLESLTDGFFTLDLDWRFTFVNGQAESMLHRPRTELLGNQIWTIFPDALNSLPHREYVRALRDNVAVQFENFYAPLETWYDVRAFPSPQGLAVYFRDITESRHNEGELRWKTALLEAQVNSSLDGMIVSDPRGRKILQNQRFADLWKTPPSIAADQDDEKQLRWNAGMSTNAEEFMEKVAYLNSHPNESSREEIELTDGTVLDRFTAPVIGQDGIYYGRIRMIRDITDRKRAEDQLRHIAGIVASSHDAILSKTLDGTILSWNPAAQALYGYTAEEAIGASVMMLIPPDRVPEEATIIARIKADEFVDLYESVRMRKDGSLVNVSLTISAVKDGAGRIIGASKIARDITERRRADAALRAATAAAEAANRAKSEFLANMSHEIRTPMNGIIGMTDLVLDTELTREQREYLGMAQSSAHSLLGLINDILDFSKIEAGKLELEAISFSLRDCLDTMLKPLGVRAGQKGVELTADIPAEVPDHLVGDPMRLRQILLNIIDNAIKFTASGDVMLRVAVESNTDDAHCLRFSIADTGIGISPEKQAMIFDAFAQADGSTTRNYGGTGLGLAIASQLVRQMGGHLWVESTVGEGTTFHFTARLPARPTPAPNARPADPRELDAMCVLVVDDNVVNRRILQAMLTNWRMQPTVVASGVAAFAEMWRAERGGTPYPLVILDGAMPGMDGFEVAEKIRAHAEFDATTMVMLSSAMPTGVAARCSELGVAGYLTKPVSQSGLLQAILTALGGTAGAELVAEAAPAIHEATAAGLRILLAEDNAINRALATALLEKFGHSVAYASNGREAVKAAAAEAFDLIFMDVQMPEMDGFEATRRIRESEQVTGRHTPIAAMTAHAMAGDRERCLAGGMDDYISKPLERAGLLALVGRVSAARNPTAATASTVAPSENQTPAAFQPPASEPAPPTVPIFSREVMLHRLDGDEALMGRMISLFREHTPRLMEDIRGSLERRGSGDLARSAHALLSSLGAFGAAHGHYLVSHLEELGETGDFTDADATFADIELETGRISAALEALSPHPLAEQTES